MMEGNTNIVLEGGRTETVRRKLHFPARLQLPALRSYLLRVCVCVCLGFDFFSLLFYVCAKK